MIKFLMTISMITLVSCKAPQEAPLEPAAEAVDLHEALLTSVEECVADEECFSKIEESEELLGNCPWYSAIGCSAAVAAAGTACVITEGEACLEALELVSAIGCCKCLPKGKVQDMCKEI